MSTQFWLGVLVTPVAAAVIFGLIVLCNYLFQRWTTWRRPIVSVAQAHKRADIAASMAIAHRLVMVRLPGGYAFAYRARVNSWVGNYRNATYILLDAIEDALGDDRAERAAAAARLADEMHAKNEAGR